MNSSFEQVTKLRPRSGETRQRLLTAAGELLAELGWGRVTTRAVAERAGLPLGAVSYHFRGKQELLSHAALATIEGLFPMDELAAAESLAEYRRLLSSGEARCAPMRIRLLWGTVCCCTRCWTPRLMPPVPSKPSAHCWTSKTKPSPWARGKTCRKYWTMRCIR